MLGVTDNASRLQSSMIFKTRTFLPSYSASDIKSILHTSFNRVGVSKGCFSLFMTRFLCLRHIKKNEEFFVGKAEHMIGYYIRVFNFSRVYSISCGVLYLLKLKRIDEKAFFCETPMAFRTCEVSITAE